MPNRDHIGRRGAALLVLACVWASIGYVTAVDDPLPPDTVYALIPVWLRAGMWFVAAALAFYYALRRDSDWPAWAALIVPVVVRGVSYGWAWVTWVLTGGQEGFARGWLTFVVYGLMVALCLILAGWKENTPPLGTVPLDGDSK